MAESQWDPLRDMEELLARYGRSAAVQPLAHGRSEHIVSADWRPLVDISETAELYLIEAEIPGVKREDVRVGVEDGVLTIRGHRELPRAAGAEWVAEGKVKPERIVAVTFTEAATTTAATASTAMLRGRMPRISPNRMRTMSPLNESVRETMMTPSANMPTNSRPMAVSDESPERLVTKLTPTIITAEPTAAPSMPGTPSNSAPATPGSTPCANASPMKARPRSTTNVPATAHSTDTRMPATSALRMNSLLEKGAINQVDIRERSA